MSSTSESPLQVVLSGQAWKNKVICYLKDDQSEFLEEMRLKDFVKMHRALRRASEDEHEEKKEGTDSPSRGRHSPTMRLPLLREKTKPTSSFNAKFEDAKVDHPSTVGELEMLAEHKSTSLGESDFVLENLDICQKARLQEMEAIATAKSCPFWCINAAKKAH